MRGTKKRLSEGQEFEIMKMILDKFLWLGFAIMAFGLHQAFFSNLYYGLAAIVTGAIILLIFAWIIVAEYEVIK